MKINTVLDYYYRAYNKAARGKAEGVSMIGMVKRTVGAGERPRAYQKIKKKLLRLVAGRFYWQNTFPTGIDEIAAATLYCLVRLARPKTVLEIGTAYGNSGIAIGQALEDNNFGELYTIDPEEQEIVNIAIKKSGLRNRIHYLLGYSYDLVPQMHVKQAEFIFIDGDHSYENVSRDFEVVKNLVPPGGFLVFHDTLAFEGPRRVIASIVASGEYEVITLPTLSGVDDNHEPAFNGVGDLGFHPVGLTVCRKKQ